MFLLKFFNFYKLKNLCILHGRVFVMSKGTTITAKTLTSDCGGRAREYHKYNYCQHFKITQVVPGLKKRGSNVCFIGKRFAMRVNGLRTITFESFLKTLQFCVNNFIVHNMESLNMSRHWDSWFPKLHAKDNIHQDNMSVSCIPT